MNQHFERCGKLNDYVIPLTTPFKDDLSLDIEGIRHNVHKAMAIPRSGGLYIGSVYQEFWSLNIEERKTLAETVVAEAKGRQPVAVGVSSPSVEQSIDLARHAEKIGADIIMAWPPIFGPRDDDGVFEFYRKVTAATGLPICVYSTILHELGYYLHRGMLQRLTDFKNIVAVKEASFSITTYLTLIREFGDRFAISTPFEEYWLAGKAMMPDKTPDFMMGSSRALYMQSERNPVLAEFLGHVHQRDFTKAGDCLGQVQRIVDLIQMTSFASGKHPIGIVKYATELLGMKGGPVRAPTPSPSAEDKAKIKELLTEIGMIA